MNIVIFVNFGLSDVLGSLIMVLLLSLFENFLWICSGFGGGGCVVFGMGVLGGLVNLLVGGFVIFIIDVLVEVGMSGILMI